MAFKEGQIIGFYHRLFQEYFTALFLSTVSDQFIGKIMDEISDRVYTDHVIPLMLSINEEKVEINWILPKLVSICESFPKLNGNLRAYARYACSPISGKIGISMRQLRYLYGMVPSSEDLRAAYDADLHIGNNLMEKDVGMQNLFSEDLESFVRLKGEIEAKYEVRTSAFDALLMEEAEH